MIWLTHPIRRHQLLSRITLAAWITATATHLVPLLIRWEDSLHRTNPYPALLAWPGTAYTACAVLSLLAISTHPAHTPSRKHGHTTTHPQSA
ncbi:hypothetical protein AV521_40990 [Streptomyces sp. IMTB 2501]|uniref:hypothetical protein n=1 Tax=Streptomyces sp. IMTB 2501 TaxID=1776340 RepID=UPI00096C581D|nr:hypothetical protein [Streptomyces sp. IMTB 2501]OLZ62795.1 hypothetical protein AV521_40990 [Streptomyces sp. IMTB 2501]